MAAKKPIKRSRVRSALHRLRRPDRAHMDVLKSRVPFWFTAAFLFAFSVLQIMLNPFGFSDLTQRYTQDIADLLITGPYFYGTEGRDKVAVALVDEEVLKESANPWPWSMGSHAAVLDAMLAYNPKAVVVDFLFVDMRPDDTTKQLTDVIAKYKKKHIPIYFEGGIELPYGEQVIRPEIKATGARILDPTVPVYNGVVRQYNVTGDCFGAKPTINGACYSAALQVFADTYPRYPLVPLNDKMEMIWGTRNAPENSLWIHQGANGASCSPDISPLGRIYLAFFDTSQVQNPCTYTAQIPVTELLQGTDDSALSGLIKDRIVFYGGSLQGAQDKISTPVNGLIPGVFAHAMAMDNLITSHGHPQQNVMTIGSTVISTNPAQMLAIIPVILVLAWLHRRRLARKKRLAAAAEHERSVTFEYVLDKFVETVWHWLAFGLALGVGLALSQWSGLSVANWVEVVFVSVELAAMLLVGAPDSLWGYLHHVVAGPDLGSPSDGEQTA
ncbi:MAG TPA: CHASE2 domain-containing protein [Rhizomicrobium sp.]|jgi:hypothetical protein